MDDPWMRWMSAIIVLGVPGVGLLVRSQLPSSRATRRREFEVRHSCRVPAALAPEMDRRLAAPDAQTGITLLALFPVLGAVPLRVAGVTLRPTVGVFVALGLGFLVNAAAAGRRAARPLAPSAAGVARVRAVTLADYVSPRLRRAAVAGQVVTLALLVASVVCLATGDGPWLPALMSLTAVALGVAGAVTEASGRRVVATPEPAASEAQLFLMDALRADELDRASWATVEGELMAVIVWGAYAALRLDLVQRAAWAWFGLGAVMLLLVWWLDRPQPSRLTLRLWPGGVPDAVQPDPLDPRTNIPSVKEPSS